MADALDPGLTLDYDRLSKKTPVTFDFMREPERAALAKDDVDSLAEIERRVRAIRQQKQTAKLQETGWYYDFSKSVDETFAPVLRWLEDTLPDWLIRGIQDVNTGAYNVTGTWAQGLLGPDSTLANDLMKLGSEVAPKDPNFVDHIFQAFGSMLPLALGSMVSGGTATALGASTTIARGVSIGTAALNESISEGGGVLRSVLEQGGTEEDAINAGLNTMMANLPLNTVLSIFGGTTGKFAKRLMLDAGKEGGQEALQGFISEVATKYGVDPNQLTWGQVVESMASPTRLYEFALGAVVGGGMGALMDAGQIRPKKETVDLSFLAQILARGEEASKLAGRSPEQYEAFLGEVFSQSGIPEEVAANAQGVGTLYQQAIEAEGADLLAINEALEDAGLNLEDLQSAVDLDETIRIPTTKIGRLAQALPGVETLFQSEVESREVVDNFIKELTGANLPLPQVEMESWARQAVAAGASPKEAGGAALIAGHWARVMSRYLGISPSEYWNKHLAGVVGPKAKVSSTGARRGKGARLFIPGSRTRGVSYELWEAKNLIPSHDPTTFEPRRDYPAGVQERDYKGEIEEQGKVLTNSKMTAPEYYVNTNPDAINGPSIVTPKGVVLGGNSRVMSIQKAYKDAENKSGDKYRRQLASQAAVFGFDPQEVAAMQEPVLVRVMDPGTNQPDKLHSLVSALNAPPTQEMGEAAKAVSRGKNISQETLDKISNLLQDKDQTLRALLDNPKQAGQILNALQKDGVIQKTNANVYWDSKRGRITQQGKLLVESSLLGAVLPDFGLLQVSPPWLLNVLGRNLDHLGRLKARGGAWDLSQDLLQAVDMVLAAEAGPKAVDQLRQYIAQQALPGMEQEHSHGARAKALAMALVENKPNAFRGKLKALAQAAGQDVEGQESMFGTLSADDAFYQQFGRVESLGQPYIKFTSLEEVREHWTKLGLDGFISERDGVINLSKIVVPGESRGQGAGTAAMKALIDYADSTAQVIALSPSKDFGATSVNRLNQFYKRFGFVKNTGKNRDYEISESMYRLPKDNGEKPNDPRSLFQSVYHGSPSRFERFALEHIGTGEGNQAYGWGLYFASKKAVAESYREKLSEDSAVLINNDYYIDTNEGWQRLSDGHVLGELGSEERPLLLAVHGVSTTGDSFDAKGFIDKQIARAEEMEEEFILWGGEEFTVEEAEQAKTILDEVDIELAEPGQLYKAEIPEDHMLLDWDKPLSEQPEMVREALDEINMQLGDGVATELLKGGTGEAIYRAIATTNISRSGYGEDHARFASEYLNSLGIKGIRYLDGGSRDAGNGSHNYVIFDDRGVEIIKTYYQNPIMNQAQKAGRRLAREMAAWKSQVRDFLGKRLKNNVLLRIGKTPDVLQKLGAKDLPLVMDQRALAKDMYDKHTIPQAIMEDLPRLIADPAAVFDSKTKPGNFLVLTEAWHGAGPIVAAVHLNKRHKRIEVNILASMYSKDASPEKFFARQVHDGRLLYVNAGKAQQVQRTGGLQLPKVMLSPNLSNSKLLTEKDIVKPILPGSLPQGNRGAAHFLPDGRAVIQLFKSANSSTLVHELGHVFRRSLENMALMPDAPERVQKDWQAMAAFVGADPKDPWSTEQEETLARAFEAYVREGKAPAPGLRGVFETFRRWLVDLYKSVRSLDVELNDDIRGVFDRMLATDTEISRARAEAGVQPFLATDDIPLSERPGYDDLVQAARAAAAENVTQHRLAEYQKSLAGWRKEGRELANSHEGQQALDELMKAGGISTESLEEAADAETVKQVRRKRVGLVKRGAPHVWELAGTLGMTERELLDLILSTPTKAEIIDQHIKQQAARHEAEAEPFELALSREYEALLEKETELLEKKAGANLVKPFKAVFNAKDVSVGDLEALNWQDLKADYKRVSKLVLDAYKGGKVEEAARLKQLQAQKVKKLRLASQARREARQAKRYLNRVARFKPQSLDLKGGIDEAFLQQIKALVGRYAGLPKTVQARRDTPSLAEFIADLPPESRPPIDPDLVDQVQGWDQADIQDKALFKKDGAKRKRPLSPINALTLPQLKELKEAVEVLEHMGRQEKQWVAKGRKMAMDQAVAKVINAIRTNYTEKMTLAAQDEGVTVGETPWQGAKRGFREVSALLELPEFIIRKLDLYQDMGPIWDMIFKPINDCSNAEQKMSARAAKEIKALYEAAPKEIRKKWTKKISIEGINQKLTGQEIFCAALNMGNAGNLEALQQGYGWEDKQIEALKDSLFKEEWELVQGMWDHIDQYFATIDEVHYQLFGRHIEKVVPETVVTKHGTYRGGYYPLSFDERKSRKIKEFKTLDAALDAAGEHEFQIPFVRRGFTMKRTGGKKPVLLDLSVFSGHVAGAIHFITHAQATKSTHKLLSDDQVRGHIEIAVGEARYKQLTSWLVGVARPERIMVDPLEKWLKAFNDNTAVAALSFNFMTAAKQPLALFQGMARVGVMPVIKALAHFATHPLQVWELVRSSSDYMANRQNSLDRDIRKAIQKEWGAPGETNQKIMKQWGFALIGFMDGITASTVWLAAYNQGLSRYKGDTTKAVDFADMQVRNTQGSGLAKDLPKILRGNEWQRTLTMFYTFFASTHNLMREEAGMLSASHYKPKAVMRFMTSMALIWIIPSILEGMGNDRERWEWKNALWDVLYYPLATIPVVREFIPAAKGFNFGTGTIGGAFSQVARIGRTAGARNPDYSKMADPALRFIGALPLQRWGVPGYAGLPSNAMITVKQGVEDLVTGETDMPEGLQFLFYKKREK
jgi:GNAT superfamily N-acetyltransferase